MLLHTEIIQNKSAEREANKKCWL